MIPADKLGHLKAGTEAAFFGALVGTLLGFILYAAGLADLPAIYLCASTGAAVASTSAGITKEIADRADNSLMASEGRAPIHGVEVLDAVATAAPGWILCIVLLVAKEALA